ncbi:MAG: shikimate dehydrogenase [Lutimonas sp.]
MKPSPAPDLKKRLYGLIGKDISYSFSRTYFTEKFENLGLNQCSYVNFDLQSMDEFRTIVIPQLHSIGGLNVTIPYKEQIIQYLDEVDQEALRIGAVNTIKVFPDGKLKGYNTDVYGFEASISKMLLPHHTSALVLGTGGASKAVAFVLEKLGLTHRLVSRKKSGQGFLTYAELDRVAMESHKVIVNCTPLGTFPEVDRKPDLPYEHLGSDHLLFDLIYNPERTSFLLEGEKRGSKILNGREMLEKQADRAWDIWNS